MKASPLVNVDGNGFQGKKSSPSVRNVKVLTGIRKRRSTVQGGVGGGEAQVSII